VASVAPGEVRAGTIFGLRRIGLNAGFSHVVLLGDMADADFDDFLDYLATDAASRAILL
jgi:hypothetical protein